VHRGEIWTYRPALPRPGQSLLRLILSAEGINQTTELPVVIGVQVLDRARTIRPARRANGESMTIAQ